MAYTIKDISAPRKGKDGKTYWHRIGTAFVSDDGKIGLTFDSLPIPDAEGKCSAQIFDRRDKDDIPRRDGPPNRSMAVAAGYGRGGKPDASDIDDDIPF